MASFAKIGLNNKVIAVVSVNNEVLKDSNGVEVEQLGIDYLTDLTGWAIWKQTSYNTKNGKYYNTDPITGVITLAQDQSKAFRKNHAGIGFTYDEDRNAFIPLKPYASWIINEETCGWEAPIAMPSVTEEEKNNGKVYLWNEENKSWYLSS